MIGAKGAEVDLPGTLYCVVAAPKGALSHQKRTDTPGTLDRISMDMRRPASP